MQAMRLLGFVIRDTYLLLFVCCCSPSKRKISAGAAGDCEDDSDNDPTFVPKKRKKKKRRWGRCRAPPLSAHELDLLTKNYKQKCPLAFTERCMKEYKELQTSPLHLNARNLFSAAIGQVVKQAKDDAPAEGNVKVLFDKLFPLCVKVFEIPPSGARQVDATPESIQKLIDDNSYTYHDCATYQKVCICLLIFRIIILLFFHELC